VRSISAGNVAALVSTNKEFVWGQQADAHEAFTLIVSKMRDECVALGDGMGNTPKHNEHEMREQLEKTSLVGHIWGVDMGQTVKCARCSYVSTSVRTEYCLCLSCTLGMTDYQREMMLRPDTLYLDHLRSGVLGSATSGAPETTLEDVIAEYVKDERINSYKCEKCLAGCMRSAFIHRAPNVFHIYIDRRQDSSLFGKINRRVNFGQRLDLSKFIRVGAATTLGPHLYSLYAIIVHIDINRSTFSGHYVAYVRSRTGEWWQLDDTLIELVSWNFVKQQHASILLYAADKPKAPEEVQLGRQKASKCEPSQLSAGKRLQTDAKRASELSASKAFSQADVLSGGTAATAVAEASEGKVLVGERKVPPELEDNNLYSSLYFDFEKLDLQESLI